MIFCHDPDDGIQAAHVKAIEQWSSGFKWWDLLSFVEKLNQHLSLRGPRVPGNFNHLGKTSSFVKQFLP